ncbi:RtcB family protein [Brooklawnia sp.]|uniref:RtcB family protein n=1 Tax=Brooklawnia sp. TaxID=2699740 RepID=UPI00311F34A1
MLTLLTDAMRAHFPQVSFDEPIQCHHNYVSEEVHDGLELVVTRKGAISARQGQLGSIPGSMGTGSFIVSGLGSAESYQSASHGAGRRMSRSRARREFTVADLAAQTEGVECRKDGGVLNEIPGAYKNLDDVMANQADLVAIEAHLTTRLCVKG